MTPEEIETSDIRNQNIHQELIAELDENFCFCFLSQAYEEILGYKQDELYNRNLQNIIHPADLGEFVRKITSVEDLNLSFNISRFSHKNGNFLYFQWTFHSYKNSENERNTVIVSNLIPDFEKVRYSISDLTKTEAHNLFSITSPRGKIVHVNNPFCNVCKYTREELIGKNHKILNSGFHSKEFFQEMYRTIRSGKIWRGEICNRGKDGRIYWLYTILVPILDRDEKLIHYLEIRTDITEKKKGQKIYLKRTGYEVIFENHPDGIVLFEIRSSKIVDCNSAFAESVGYTKKELIGQSIDLIRTEEAKKIISDFRLEESNSNEVNRIQEIKTIVEHRHKNGMLIQKEVIIQIQKADNDDLLICYDRDISGQLKAEKKLKANEEYTREANQLLTTILDHTPVMVVNLDSKFNFIRVNRAYAETCKYPISFFSGKNHFELYPHEENQMIFQRVVDTGEPFFVKAKPFEFPDQRERGTTYWDWSLIPIKDEKGKVKNLIFTLEEVTNRVKVEKIQEDSRKLEQETTLKLHEAFLKATQRQFAIDQHAIVAITNRAGTITYVNERFCEISQYSKEELLGKNHRIINSGFHSKEFFQDMYSTIKKGDTWHGEIRNRAKDGSFYWVATTIVPLKNTEEKIERYFSIRTVITKRVEAEEALRVSKANMQAILDNSFESILLFDPARKLQFFNQIASIKILEIFGKQLQIGSCIYDMLLPQDRENFEVNFKLALQGKRIIVDKSFLVDKFEYWFELQYAPVINADKESIGVLITARDINEKKRTERKLAKHMQELENLNQTKDKFFSIIAHDLRNPFAGIIGVSEILVTKLKSLKSEEANHLLHYNQIVLNTSKSSYSLLENLLFWAKTQTGDIRMNPANLSFNFLVSSTILVISINAIKKNIEIILDLADNTIVYADESSVNTILRNLITNAIKFTYPNGKITISTQCKEKFLEVSITDTGVGMDSKHVGKIFRIDSKTSMPGTENEQGTGLGLILCRELIQKQGGEIWVESQLGVGSKFTFTLPLDGVE